MVENRAAIDRNHEALKRILASLFAMAARASASGTFLRACGDAGSAATLPRHLYFAILLVLRPAEAATRRLIIVLSRGISVTLPPLRPAKPKSGPVFLKDGRGTGIVDTGISLYRLGLANVAPPIAPSAPLLRPERSPSRCSIPCEIRSPAAGHSRGAPPFPVASSTSPTAAPFPSGGCHRPTIRSTPRVLVSALQHLRRRWTTCRPRRSVSRAGAPAATGCAASHLLPADFAASGRCDRAARPVGGSPASIRSPGG